MHDMNRTCIESTGDEERGPVGSPVAANRVPADSLPEHVCVITGQGVVQGVDTGWRAFVDARYVGPAEITVGSNYLAGCDSTCRTGRASACEFAAGVRGVLGGRSERFEMEYPCHTPAGERWFEARVTRLPGQSGLCVIAHEDVTSHHRGKQDLALFRSAMNVAGDAMFLIEYPAMRVADVNDEACRMLRYPRAELLALAPEAIFRMNRGELERVWNALLGNQGKTHIGDTRLVCADGIEIEVEIHHDTVRVGNRILIAAVARDIGVRLEVEGALKMQVLQQRLLAQFGQTALEGPALDELMTQAGEVLKQGLQVDLHRLLMSGSDEGTLHQVAGSGWDVAWTREHVFQAIDETEDHFVIGTREAITIEDFESGSRPRRSAILAAHGVRSAVEVLICGAAGPYGVIGAYDRSPGRFDGASANFVQSISNTLAAAIDRIESKHAFRKWPSSMCLPPCPIAQRSWSVCTMRCCAFAPASRSDTRSCSWTSTVSK